MVKKVFHSCFNKWTLHCVSALSCGAFSAMTVVIGLAVYMNVTVREQSQVAGIEVMFPETEQQLSVMQTKMLAEVTQPAQALNALSPAAGDRDIE